MHNAKAKLNLQREDSIEASEVSGVQGLGPRENLQLGSTKECVSDVM